MTMSSLRISILMWLSLTVIFGGLYPALVTGISKAIFPAQATGSLIRDEAVRVVGSRLVGQEFSDPDYFWGRLSATVPMPYNAASSSGSNYGPNNDDLMKTVQARVKALHDADPGNESDVPVDLVTASASGLDPDISIAAARYQAARVARLRGLTEKDIDDLITKNTQPRAFGVLGEPVVNVLMLNLDIHRKAAHATGGKR
ncbi:MAG: potassium-transporting ATPase subunit KdpC [Alphaproteobacteria bacterium]|nr:potassium-transporting ATPase subunit KdpC [Alphaproteobacteria bacterium]